MTKSVLARLGSSAVGVVISLGVPLDGTQTPWTVTPIAALEKTPPQAVRQPGRFGLNRTQQWRRMTQAERVIALEYILNSPMGIVALNQLAIEGFISPGCRKTFYINDQTAGFQTLLRVKCPTERGTSIAVGYDEVRVIFNRFEDNIEGFEVKRVYPGQPVTPPLPE